MNSSQQVLVVDVGTSSLRAILYNREGCPVIEASHEYSPRFLDDGRVEQNPDIWITGMIDVVRRCMEVTPKIAGIALTSARSSVLPVDQSGDALMPAIMWQDRRSQIICDELRHKEAGIYAKTGMKLNTVVSAPKITWLKRYEPSIYRRAAKIVGIQDYLIHYLTGRFCTDHSFGSRTLLMNLRNREWDPELLELFDIHRDKLCELLPPGTVCGGLGPNAAGITGLPQGTPVLTAGGDQQCAAIGQGLIQPGGLAVNTGTGAYIIRSLDKPVMDPGGGLFCNASALGGQYILEASVLAAGSLYNWFCSLFGSVEKEGRELFRRIDALIQETPPGSNGVVMVPDLAGRGSPDWDSDAKAAFINLTLETSPGDLARGALEGLVCDLKNNLEHMRRLTGRETFIRLSGGMSRFAVYNQMLADAFGGRVSKCPGTQSTALGAWIMAVTALGIIASAKQAYQQAMMSQEASSYFPTASGMELFDSLLARRRAIATALDSVQCIVR